MPCLQSPCTSTAPTCPATGHPAVGGAERCWKIQVLARQDKEWRMRSRVSYQQTRLPLGRAHLSCLNTTTVFFSACCFLLDSADAQSGWEPAASKCLPTFLALICGRQSGCSRSPQQIVHTCCNTLITGVDGFSSHPCQPSKRGDEIVQLQSTA